MKSYIKNVLIAGMAAAGMASCTDLDTEIVGNYIELPDDPIVVSSEFEGCYHYTRNEAWFGRNFWEGVFLAGDEALGINWNGSYEDNGRYRDGAIHRFRPDLQGVGLMGDMLSGVTYTNGRIKLFGGMDGKDPMVAPLRAIRAYYTFWMMELYGDVPILERNLEADEVAERKPRAEVARWIEQELLEAIPHLTETNDVTTYGRPNKWMAEALLVKLYLNWGVYTNPITTVDGSTPNPKLNECIKWCDEIINSGLFEVGDGYRKKFFPDNGVHIRDFIYAVDFDPEKYGNGTWKYAGGHELNRFWDFKKYNLLEPCIWNWTPKNSVAGVYILTPEAVSRFNLPGDERNEMVATADFPGYDLDFKLRTEPIKVFTDARHRRPYVNADGNSNLTYIVDGFEWANLSLLDVGPEDNVANHLKGARLFKYPVRQEDDLLWERKQSNDIPVFRFADILLTKAECILRGGTPTPVSYTHLTLPTNSRV